MESRYIYNVILLSFECCKEVHLQRWCSSYHAANLRKINCKIVSYQLSYVTSHQYKYATTWARTIGLWKKSRVVPHLKFYCNPQIRLISWTKQHKAKYLLYSFYCFWRNIIITLYTSIIYTWRKIEKVMKYWLKNALNTNLVHLRNFYYLVCYQI